MTQHPTNTQYRNTAKVQYEEEGQIEIDDNAKVSRSSENDGAYVQAWVWVDRHTCFPQDS